MVRVGVIMYMDLTNNKAKAFKEKNICFVCEGRSKEKHKDTKFNILWVSHFQNTGVFHNCLTGIVFFKTIRDSCYYCKFVKSFCD